MKKITLIALCALAFAACKKDSLTSTATTPQVEANWSSTDQYGSWSNGGYDFNNDVWGSGAGPQSIWANSYANWGIWAQHSGGGIKSYPHEGKFLNNNVNSFSSIKSTWAVTNPTYGAYNTSYDIWFNSQQIEVMLWTNKIGSIKPISDHYDSNGAVAYYSNQSIGGHTWNVYAGPHGTGRTISLVRTSNSNGGTVDLLAIFKWLENVATSNSAFSTFNNPYLQNVEFGWEITNTNGTGTNFQCTNFNVLSN